MGILDAIKARKSKGFKIEISIEPSDEKSTAKEVEIEVEKESGDKPSDDGIVGPDIEIENDSEKKPKTFFEKVDKNMKDFASKEAKGKGKK